MEDKAPPIAALTEDQISRISGLTKSQLRAWDRKGFFAPKHAYHDRAKVFSRIYSFRDAIGLRTLAKLRSKPFSLSLKRLEHLAEMMAADGIEHWADARIWIVKGEPSYLRPNSDEVKGAETGQLAMLPIIDVIREVEAKIEELKQRPEAKRGSVERNRHVARHSWVIAGTRIPTATIRRYKDAGFSDSDILSEYPSLTHKDIKAAMEHEAQFDKSA